LLLFPTLCSECLIDPQRFLCFCFSCNVFADSCRYNQRGLRGTHNAVKTYLFTHDEQVITAINRLVPNVYLQQDPNGAFIEADLYLWDLDTCIEVPIAIAERGREQQLLLIVSQSKLPEIPENLLLRTCTLLKPISPFTLRAFIDLAVKKSELRERTSQVDRLRSERHALIQYILAANLRLQEYDQQRTQFLSRALHDFRAPLIALYGYCGLLADGQLGPVSRKQQELLRRMQASTKRLSRQADGMFELSVFGQVTRRPQMVNGHIEETIAQAVHDVLPLAQEKDLKLRVQAEASERRFLFEPEQIQQVLINLLENSCKFSYASTSIEVRGYNVRWNFVSNCPIPGHVGTADMANAYRIDIEDCGPGIRPDLLSSIFEEYTSYGEGTERSGGGLGLAISKMIVSTHQGCIWAGNSPRGAVFSFVLPFYPSPQLFKQRDAASHSCAEYA
jgi:signal transduction histidine kinase